MIKTWVLLILVNGQVGLVHKEEFPSRRDCVDVLESVERYVATRYEFEQGTQISYECRMILTEEK